MPSPSRLPSVDHRFVDTGLVRIHVAELPGSGPPLLLLHGVGMDWRVWQAISRRLHPHFHLFMLDLRGHGDSGKPAHGYSLAHYASDVEEVIERLGLQQVALVGSSLGGMVTAVVEAPVDVVAHRVLVDPPLTGGPVRDQTMLATVLRLKHEAPSELADYLAGFNPGMSRFFLQTMAEMWQETADGVINEMLQHSTDYFAIDASLKSDESPSLLMRADPSRGAVLSPSEARRALKLLPCGSQVEVIGAGHAIHAYKPAEFTALVKHFVLTPK